MCFREVIFAVFSVAALGAQMSAPLAITPPGTTGAVIVRITCTPESLGANPLGIKNVGTWNCGVTNYSNRAVTVTPSMLMEAVPNLHAIDPRRAALNVQKADSKSVRKWALRVIKYGAIPALAFMGGGSIAASKLVIAAVGAGTNVIRDINDELTAAQPDLSAFVSTIPAKIKLAAFQSDGDFSATLTVYASKMKHPETQKGTLYFP